MFLVTFPQSATLLAEVFLSCRFYFLVFSWLSLPLLFAYPAITVAGKAAMKRLGVYSFGTILAIPIPV